MSDIWFFSLLATILQEGHELVVKPSRVAVKMIRIDAEIHENYGQIMKKMQMH